MDSNYQVIARRWRPKRFDELVGQEHIVRTLRHAIERDRIAHAYLFVGPRGTGKTSTARLFAQALNCEGGPSVEPDPNSDICQAIARGSCMDVIEIDGASNNSVDQIRDLRDDVQYAPAQCRFKIYIIDEVHMLSTAAFNALLKTLEEPPAHVKFIFATTESQKVLPTITSRCQRFEFRPIDEATIAAKLQHIAEAEGIQAEPAALAAVARLAEGGMRDAQSTLDQLISFCGDNITEQDVIDVYGLAGEAEIASIVEAIAKADYKEITLIASHLSSQGRDLHRILSDVEAYIYKQLHTAIASNGSVTLAGASLTVESLMRTMQSLQASAASLKNGLSTSVQFEVALLRAVESSRARAIDTLIKSLAAGTAGVPHQSSPVAFSSPSPVDVIPESTQHILEESFRGKVTGVRELDPAKLQ